MILYFSGTGNSEYVAEKLAQATGEPLINLFERIRRRDFSAIHSDTMWIVVSPTYAWRIPRILQEWLERTELSGSKDIAFVMTCGENIGNAGKYVKKLCAAKGMNDKGCIDVVMPENYLAMFTTPSPESARKIVAQANARIERVSEYIVSGNSFPDVPIRFTDRLISGIVNDLFYAMCVRDKKFYATDACISCGKCTQVCPLNNVRLENGKPQWAGNCTHCMACICRCPKEAIEYGKHSRGLPRYVCPEVASIKTLRNDPD